MGEDWLSITPHSSLITLALRAGFDWDVFVSRKLPAPYVPQHGGDTVNFRSAHKLNHVFHCKRTLPPQPFEDC